MIDTQKFRSLLQSKKVFAVDVIKTGAVWNPNLRIWIKGKKVPSIPGSYRMPSAGLGNPNPENLAYFKNGLNYLKQKFPGKKPVFFCKRNCWLSWNAARRAKLEKIFDKIYWYPGGVEAWRDQGFKLTAIKNIDFDIRPE